MTLPAWVPSRPDIVLHGRDAAWSITELAHRVDAWIEQLNVDATCGAPIGLIADNGPEWIAIDLAAHVLGATLVPLPSFFTHSQLLHVAQTTDMQSLLCADAAHAASLGFSQQLAAGDRMSLFARPGKRSAVAPHLRLPVQKITFTSGTTGAPRGVRLTSAAQSSTASALAIALAPLDIRQHLSLLPYSLLLENVAGIYTALMLGASCACPPLDTVGLTGACRFDANRCLEAIGRYGAHSVIVLPQMLSALVEQLSARRAGDDRIRSLRFVAVGGGRTAPSLIARARALGLPVYEGYGLSECASVVSLNRPGADRLGTVGRALPGTSVRLAPDGEIEVAGRDFAGYVGSDSSTPQAVPCACSATRPASASEQEPSLWIRTGDIGMTDEMGFLSIVGRKSNVIVTSFGRNIAPEWPEGVLTEQPAIAQAVVFGDARPHLAAVIVARGAELTDTELELAVAAANWALPDYARIGCWCRAEQAFDAANGLCTPNGRIRRQAVFARYRERLDELHSVADQDS